MSKRWRGAARRSATARGRSRKGWKGFCATMHSMSIKKVSTLSPREYHAQREIERLRQREQLRQQQLDKARRAIQRLAPEQPAIEMVYLFGPVMAEGRFTQRSDIDLAVVADDVAVESRFWRALEEALEWNVDVRPLQGAVAQAVADHGECVYARKSHRSGTEHSE